MCYKRPVSSWNWNYFYLAKINRCLIFRLTFQINNDFTMKWNYLSRNYFLESHIYVLEELEVIPGILTSVTQFQQCHATNTLEPRTISSGWDGRWLLPSKISHTSFLKLVLHWQFCPATRAENSTAIAILIITSINTCWEY